MNPYTKNYKACKKCPKELCRNNHYYNYLILGKNFTVDCICLPYYANTQTLSVSIDIDVPDFPVYKKDDLNSLINGLLDWKYLELEDWLYLLKLKGGVNDSTSTRYS